MREKIVFRYKGSTNNTRNGTMTVKITITIIILAAAFYKYMLQFFHLLL